MTTDKPRVTYIANMHGDEVMGREMMLRLIDLLGVGTDPDPQINAMLAALRSNAEIMIMPSLNPDGYEAQKRNDCWRSNGTNHATCYNGSDLNRSFPNKQTNQSDSSSGRPVEVVAMMDRFFKSKPESFGGTLVPYAHPFVLGANFHGGTTVMNLAYDTCPNTGSPTAGCASYYPDSGAIFDDDLEVKSLGREYANLNPVMNAIADTGSFYNGLTYGYEWYLIAGGMQDWATVYSGRDSIHTTVELTTTKWPTFASATEGVAVSWANNKLALVTYLYRGLKGIHVAVVDSAGQPINGATVAINGRAITYGATNKIHHAAGRSVSPANAGYNANQKAAYLGGAPVDADSPISVTVSAPGRTTAIVPVSPSIFAGDYTTVTLQ